MDQPQNTQPPAPPAGKKKGGWFWGMIASGVLMTLAPLAGIMGTILGMTRSFKELEKGGHGNPEELASDISLAFMTTVGGIGLAVLMLPVFILCLVMFLTSSKRRPPAGR